MDPTKRGCDLQGDKLTPIIMKNSPAPDVLLNMIQCDCVGRSSTLRCSCKKFGLECTAACGSCQDGNLKIWTMHPFYMTMRSETDRYDIFKALIWRYGMNGIRDTHQCLDTFSHTSIIWVAQNKIPHQTICNIFATSDQILKILEAV